LLAFAALIVAETVAEDEDDEDEDEDSEEEEKEEREVSESEDIDNVDAEFAVDDLKDSAWRRFSYFRRVDEAEEF